MNTTAGERSLDVRRDQLRALSDAVSADAIVLRRSQNFAWYTAGADNRVDRASPTGVADIVVTRDGEFVLTNTIEAHRFRTEQTPSMSVVDYPWFESPLPMLRDLCGAGTIASDWPGEGEIDVSPQLAPMRYVLSADAIEQYRAVGADTFAAMEETAESLRPGMTEFEALAVLQAACARRGMSTPVAMAAGDDRIQRFRHPTPVDHVFHRRVMLVVCAERGGLYGNFTRFRDFEDQDPAVQRRMELSHEILDRMRLEATRAGRTLADALADCRRFYADCGFPEEWRLHHQGGLTGYASRELVATPHTNQRIEIGQAFAWNPSITGSKAEETFVLTHEGAETLTRPAG